MLSGMKIFLSLLASLSSESLPSLSLESTAETERDRQKRVIEEGVGLGGGVAAGLWV